MNLDLTEQLRGPLQDLIDSGSRTNSNKPERYWYPLSTATYQVDEVLAAVDSLCSFRTTMWEKTAEFERRFAERNGQSEAIMVNSGSSADLLIAFALVNPEVRLLQPGDEVLIPAVTWPTQVWSAMMAGLRVRFVDVDPQTCNVSPEVLEDAITERTRAVSLVHLMGNPCDMDRVVELCRRRDLVLFEDCCESLGAKYNNRPVGSFGVAASFSFFFSHHITTMEGGMITCDDEALSDVFRLLRAHGWGRNARYQQPKARAGIDPRYTFLNWGFNVRPTELQAGFGLVQLDRLPGFHDARRANAAHFEAAMQPLQEHIQLMDVLPQAECSWFALPLLVAEGSPIDRDALTGYLEREGVETRPIVAGNLARHPVVDVFPEIEAADLPGADLIHDRGFYLGLHPVDSREKLDRLVALLDDFVRRHS